MAAAGAIMFSLLMATALSAPVKYDEESTLFLGEDFHIPLPSTKFEVTFKNYSDRRNDVVLMRGGNVVNDRAKLNFYETHLVIEKVGEEDEGVYTMKNPDNPDDVKRIKLIVRDCSNEKSVMYGHNFQIPLLGDSPSITLEYRHISVEANNTSSRLPVILWTSVGVPTEGYLGRIEVVQHQVILKGATGADKGSYTVRDAKGNIQTKLCLNVRGHQNFEEVPYGKQLKIDLVLNSSLVHLYYTPNNAPTEHLLLDKGEFTNARTELGLDDRLTLEGSMVLLDRVSGADAGLFKITDILGFTVSYIHLKVKPYQLETLYVAIIALLGLLVFLLLVCLLSCLIKVKKRAKRAAALEKLAQNAGKENEGEAFRQVVKNITKLSEHSQADVTEKSQSTEVDIKGLEVSSKEVGVNNLETSDSGVGFNTALPLDTDTDAPDPMSESTAVTISVAPEPKPSPSAAESSPSAPPAAETEPSPVAETKAPEKTPEQPEKAKLDAPKPPDVKLSPAPSPEPKAALSPADPKPAASPSPEPKPATPKAASPAPTPTKSLPSPTPEPPKPSTPEPITNGTPEPGLDSKSSPDHAEIIDAPATKTPEVELKSAAVEASKEATAAEESTTTTTTT
ncbi:uncharacterized protein LOC142898194 isoform X2 [Nelusetta ayraudi]